MTHKEHQAQVQVATYSIPIRISVCRHREGPALREQEELLECLQKFHYMSADELSKLILANRIKLNNTQGYIPIELIHLWAKFKQPVDMLRYRLTKSIWFVTAKDINVQNHPIQE